MASSLHHLLLILTFIPLFKAQQPTMFPFPCTKQIINTCTSTLYHITTTNSTTTIPQLSLDYSVQPSQIKPITHIETRDFLVTVPCTCQTAANQTTAYFYNVDYTVKPGDTFFDVSRNVYSGQVWAKGDEQGKFVVGNNVTMSLLCGCLGSRAENVVTYTVQDGDTLFGIASMLGSDLGEIEKLNSKLLGNSSSGLIDVGWVLYVPVGAKNGTLFG
ncbi:hypothetical protein LINPERHAP1_LOCUS20489 [Linum perenne]